ncbi:MAG: alpha/beta fold hydrolase [Rhizobiales bacterium]|nr:alpha/beta fold hydrolase [Hyphomicrobiales bacterium]MBN9010220.1 alpha/beta fold hydrolase [Hyphomicrobiales bacterium]
MPALDGELNFLAVGESGPPALLLHGFGSDRSSWRLNQGELGKVARTIAVDLPGHGLSPTDVGDGSVATLSRAVEAFADHHFREPAHLLGHSLGGAIAVDLANRRPDLARSLFLVAPAWIGRRIDEAFLARYVAMESVEEAEAVLRGLVARPRLIGRQMAAAVLAELQRPGVRPALKTIAASLVRAGPAVAAAAAAVGGMALPKMVVWGAADLTRAPDEATLAALKAEVTVLADTGHLPHMENSAEVNRLMRAFLATAA